MFRVKVVDHPYAQAVLTKLRHYATGQIEFRKGLVRLGRIMGFEIIKDFPVREVKVRTPLGEARGIEIEGMDNVIIVTVLRAAWPMTEGLIKVFPQARQGIVSARRVEERGMREDYTFDIEITYVKLPKVRKEDRIIIVDPMVATASTIMEIIKRVVKFDKAREYMVVSAIATQVAIKKLEKLAEELNINLTLYTVAIDEEINEKGYIVPGLGDAGDRAFGE